MFIASSAPGDRFTAVGYQWAFATEILSTSVWGSGAVGNTGFELISLAELAATANLKALLAAPYHLAGAMSLNRDLGVGISNQATSPTTSVKTVNIDFATRAGLPKQQLGPSTIATFPCNGVGGVGPVFAGEEPDPFPDVNRDLTPYGHPVYVMASLGSTISLNMQTSSVIPRGGAPIPMRLLTSTNDPNGKLGSHQLFFVPVVRLADNTTYDVILDGTLSTLVSSANPTGAWSRSFSFTTGAFRGE